MIVSNFAPQSRRKIKQENWISKKRKSNRKT
jgi:hypothetical protein